MAAYSGKSKNDDDENEEHSNDWDVLFYISKIKLQMSIDDFWSCTPAKFNKLYYFWRVENGLEKPEQEIFMGDVEY